VLFDRICAENGIRHLLTAPRSPTTTGKVERWHKTIRAEFLVDHDYQHATIAELQQALDAWVDHYNSERPHQSLGMRPPIDRFRLAAPELDPAVEAVLEQAAELIARSGARLELVTPERMLGVEVGGMNHVPYARAFNETDTRITLNQKVLAVRPEAGRLCVDIGSEQSLHRVARHVDQVVVDYGTAASADLYFELKPLSSNRGAVDYGALLDGRPQSLVRNADGAFQLFRIGDCVSSRNIHAAVYDALRLVKDL